MESFDVTKNVRTILRDLDIILYTSSSHNSIASNAGESLVAFLIRILQSTTSPEWLKLLCLFRFARGPHLSIENTLTVAPSILSATIANPTQLSTFQRYQFDSLAQLELSTLPQDCESQLLIFIRNLCDELLALFNHPNTILESHIKLSQSLCTLLACVSNKTKFLLLEFASSTLTTISEKVKTVLKNHSHVRVIKFMVLMWTASITVLSCSSNAGDVSLQFKNCSLGDFSQGNGEASITMNVASILRLIAPVADVGLMVSPLNRMLKVSRLWTSICFYNLVLLLRQFPSNSWLSPTYAYKLILRFMHRFLLDPFTPALLPINELEGSVETEDITTVMMTEHAQTLRITGISLWSIFQSVLTDLKTITFLQDVSVSVPAVNLPVSASAVTSRAVSPSISRTVAADSTQATTANNKVKVTVMDLLHSVDELVRADVNSSNGNVDSSVLERLLISIHLRASFKMSQALSNGYLLPSAALPASSSAAFLLEADEIEDLRYYHHHSPEQSVEQQLKQQLDGGLFRLRHIFHSEEFTANTANNQPPRLQQQRPQDAVSLQTEIEQWMARWRAFHAILSSPSALSWLEIYNDSSQVQDASASMAVHWELLVLHRTHALFHAILHESVRNHQGRRQQQQQQQFVGDSNSDNENNPLTQWYQSTQLESLSASFDLANNHHGVPQQVVLNSLSPFAIDLVKDFLVMIIQFMSKSLPLVQHLFTLQHNAAAEGILSLQEHVLASFWWLLHRTTGFAIDFLFATESPLLASCCSLHFQSMPETTLGTIFALTLQHTAVINGKSNILLKDTVCRCINSMTEQAVLPSMFEKIAAVIATTRHHHAPHLTHQAHGNLPFMLEMLSLKASEVTEVVNENVLDFLAYFTKLAVKRLSRMDVPTASEQMSVDVMQSMTSGLCDMMHCVLLFMLQPCRLLHAGCQHVLQALFDVQYTSESFDELWQLWIRLDDVYQGLLLHHMSSVDDEEDVDSHQAICCPILSSAHSIAIHVYGIDTSTVVSSVVNELRAQLLLWLRLLETVKHFLTLRPAAYLALKLKGFLLRCLKARFFTFMCLIINDEEGNAGEYVEFMLSVVNVIYEVSETSFEQASIVEINAGAILSDSQVNIITCTLLLAVLPSVHTQNREAAQELALEISKLLQQPAGANHQSELKALLLHSAQSLLPILHRQNGNTLAGWELYSELIVVKAVSAAAVSMAQQQQRRSIVDLTISNHSSQQIPPRAPVAAPSRGQPPTRGRAATAAKEAGSFDFYAVPDTTGPISGNTKDGDETYASWNTIHHEKEVLGTENTSSGSVLLQQGQLQLQQHHNDDKINVDNDNDNHDRRDDSQDEAEQQAQQHQIESQAPSMPSPIMPNSQQTRHSLSSGKRTRPSPLLSTSHHGPTDTTARKRRRLVGSEYETIEELLATINNRLQQSRNGGIADENGKESLLLEALQESHGLSSAILDLIIQPSYPHHMQKMADEEENAVDENIS